MTATATATRAARWRPRSACVALLFAALVSACRASVDEVEDPMAAQGVRGSASDGIVYVRAGETNADLWRARISDGALRRLTHTPDLDEGWPHWSPDASLLVFETTPAGRRKGTQLRLWDPEGGPDVPLPAPRSRRQDWAEWQPGGPRLVFAFRSFRGKGPAFGVAVLEPRTRERVLLARVPPGELGYFRPELAPDGRRAVAQRKIALDENSQLWLLEAGAPPRLLAGEDGAFVSKGRFTRDGQRIVFTRQEDERGPGDVMLMRADGTGQRALASTPESDDHTARISPTRDEMAFISDRDGKEDLFLADLDGGSVRNLTRALGLAVRVPRWSPDGERVSLLARPAREPVAFDNRARRAAQIIVVDREGRLLLTTSGYSADFMPAWR